MKLQQAKFFSGTKNASSWSLRAWLALRAAKMDFTETVVDIRRPQRFANLKVIAQFSPSASVPALKVGNVIIYDSLAIMELANEVSAGRLMPLDPIARAEARSLIGWQHSGLSGICHRISFESAFYPDKRELDEEELRQASRLYQVTEPLLSKYGGPFLFGNEGLADYMLVPAVIRLTSHAEVPAEFPLTREWARQIMHHEWVAEWMAEAEALPPIWFDEYLLPEREYC